MDLFSWFRFGRRAKDNGNDIRKPDQTTPFAVQSSENTEDLSTTSSSQETDDNDEVETRSAKPLFSIRDKYLGSEENFPTAVDAEKEEDTNSNEEIEAETDVKYTRKRAQEQACDQQPSETRKKRRIVIVTPKRMGSKRTNVKRVITAKQNVSLGLDKHHYIADNNDTCQAIVKKVHVCDGNAGALASLNSPYNGRNLKPCSKLVRGTRLRIDDSVANPGDIYSSDGDSGDDEDVCSFCLQPNSTKGNLIVYCDRKGCSIKLHQRNCGGPSKIPKSKWFCEPCSSGMLVNMKGELPEQCYGCESRDASKPWIQNGGRWMHIQCQGEGGKPHKKKLARLGTLDREGG